MVGRKPGYMKAASTCNKPGSLWDGIALQIVYLKSEINEKLNTVKEYDKQNFCNLIEDHTSSSVRVWRPIKTSVLEARKFMHFTTSFTAWPEV
jgi:hypothetical protein